MSVTLTDIRNGLVTNIETEINPLNTQISPYLLSNPTFPVIMIFPEKADYDLAGRRGLDKWTLIIQALVGTTLDIGAQQNLDVMLAPSGSGSIKAAVESDPTLGGKVQTVRVTECSGYQLYKIATYHALGAEWTVEVFASGS